MAKEKKYGNTTVVIIRPDNRLPHEEIVKILREVAIKALKNKK